MSEQDGTETTSQVKEQNRKILKEIAEIVASHGPIDPDGTGVLTSFRRHPDDPEYPKYLEFQEKMKKRMKERAAGSPLAP